MSSATNVGIYISNFDTQNPTPAQLQQLSSYASAIGQAGYTTGIFWALHVNAAGDFIYNNGPAMISGGQLQSGFSNLPGLIATIKGAGNVKQLFFSSGGWTCESDFVNMGNLIQQYGTGTANPLYQNFQALQSLLSIDGIDFDLEAGSSPAPYGHAYDYYTSTIVQLTQMLNSLGMAVTYCPYTAQDFWLGCLAQVYRGASQQLVSGLNLQCYAGGAPNTQQQWVTYLQQSTSPLGIANPAAFVNAGYSSLQSDGSFTCGAPSVIQSDFANQNQPAAVMATGAQSGWIWNSSQIAGAGSPGTFQQYAQAIISGLGQL